MGMCHYGGEQLVARVSPYLEKVRVNYIPIYEYECPVHGVMEFIHTTIAKIPYIQCPKPKCFETAEKIISLTSMQPDNLWSGVMTQQGYVTSKQELRRREDEKGITHITHVSEIDSMKRRAKRIQEEDQQKRDAKRVETIAEKLKGVDIDHTGIYQGDKGW